jgi:hypothetical protein
VITNQLSESSQASQSHLSKPKITIYENLINKVEKACCNIIDEASQKSEPVSQEAGAVCQEADHHLRLRRHLPGSLSFCKKGKKLVFF